MPPKKKKSKKIRWDLRLYVAGQTPRAKAAVANLEKLCEEYLPGEYRLEVIDLIKKPHLARADQILAVPALVRRLPPPLKRMIGDLSDKERIIVGLDLRPVPSAGDSNNEKK